MGCEASLSGFLVEVSDACADAYRAGNRKVVFVDAWFSECPHMGVVLLYCPDGGGMVESRLLTLIHRSMRWTVVIGEY